MHSWIMRGCCVGLLLLVSASAYSAGQPYSCQVFATAGSDPAIWAIVKDSNGIGCGGVAVSVSVTAGEGAPVQSDLTTDAGGLAQTSITAGALGSTVNVFCSAVAVGLSNSIIASAARTVVATDSVVSWFDEARAKLGAALINPASKVLVTGGTMDNDDITSTDSDAIKRITFGLIQNQTAAQPFWRDVCQGTYKNSNLISVNVNETTANPDALVSLASLSTTRFLRAFARGGADPALTAVVFDREGRGLAGVTLTASASSGSLSPLSAMTNDQGVALFQQSGGVLGDTLTVSSSLPELAPVAVITQASPALAASNQTVAWFECKTRMVRTALIDRSSHVLVAASSDLRSDVYEVNADNLTPNRGDFVEQTFARPGSTYVVYGGSEAGDLVRVYHYGTVHRYPGGPTYNAGLYGNAVLTLPASESRYLMAAAAGGLSPWVWAIVTDGDGNGVPGVPVAFSLSGPGTLAAADTVTAWGGLAVNRVSGGSYGNTLTVSSPNLGEVVIYLSDLRTPSAVDRVYAAYDAASHMVHSVLVQPENNVMTASFTEDQMQGNADLDMTSANGVNASIGTYFSPQTPYKLCQSYTGFGTIGAGDILRLSSNYVAGWDFYIQAAADPERFLQAFAFPGPSPEIWAVVMDRFGNAVANQPVTVDTTAGTLDQSSGTTHAGGYFTVRATSPIAYGNTITVSSPGLPPVSIWTSPAANYANSDKAYMWFDPTSLLLRHVCVEIEKNVLTSNAALTAANIQVVDNTPDNAGTIGKGGVYDQYGGGVPLRIGTAFLCPGTAGVGDVVKANFNTSNTLESFITLQRLNTRFLQAYAQYGSTASCNLVGVVIDEFGVGVPNIRINATTLDGTLSSPPPGGFRTGIDGSVQMQFTATVPGWYKKITLTTPDFENAPVEVITNNETDIQPYYKAIPYYDPFRRRLNTAFAHEYFNTLPYTASSIPIETITPIDQTNNSKALAVSPMENQTVSVPGMATVAFGTNETLTLTARDQISVDDATALGSPDALISLPSDPEKNLFAFGTAGALPVTLTAVVVDKSGNGLPGETVTFSSSGTLSVTTAVTDAAGMAQSVLTGLSSAVLVDAPFSVTYTATVQPGAAVPVQANSRTFAWYSILEHTVRAAVVSLSGQLMATGSNLEFSAQDMTSNGKTLTLGSAVQQTGGFPASVQVTNGTQGQTDRVTVNETNTYATPDAVLSLTVPSAELIGSLSAGPPVVSTGQAISVTLTVFNNGSPDASGVMPAVPGVVGNATWVSGPVPASQPVLNGGDSCDFVWTYQATAPGDAIFTGYAFGTDTFSGSGVTSTPVASAPVAIENQAALAASLSGPTNAERLKPFTLTLRVQNTGQTDALTVTPQIQLLPGTSHATFGSGPLPASATIPGGAEQTFTWIYSAADLVGWVQFSALAQGTDAHAGVIVSSATVLSGQIQVVQGALNLDRVGSSETTAFPGQRQVPVFMDLRNTSLVPVTLTAATLTFNGGQDHFRVQSAPGNPVLIPALSSVTLDFLVDIESTAPLGSIRLNGTVSGDSPDGAMAANGALQTSVWTLLEPVNRLEQNYPNPLRLSAHDSTTFEYTVKEDVRITLKIYTLAGELAAVLVDGYPGVGRHQAVWAGDNGDPGRPGKPVGSGVYLAVFQSGDHREIKKAVVIR